MRDANALMAARNRFSLMIVATIAGVFRIFARVANLTSHLALIAMVQREAVSLQFCRGPRLSGMAILALEPKKSSVDVWFEWGLDTSYGNSTSPQAMTNPGAFSGVPTNFFSTWHLSQSNPACLPSRGKKLAWSKLSMRSAPS